jgi:uncharacterized protein (DUF1697 family)
MRYLALLRGINVGGSNKVDMSELTRAFEDVGMASVKTYINSGNVIFSSALEDRTQLTELLVKSIRERFGLEIQIILRDAEQMRTLVDAMPTHWVNDASMKCDVVFLGAGLDAQSVIDTLGVRPEIEDVVCTAGAMVWRADRENATKSRLTKMVGTPLYRQVTVRNCNTARKLLQLMDG